MADLFKVPISTGGAFTCTSPSKAIYLLSFESPPDNRTTSAFLSAFLLSLNILEHKYPKGVLITTSGISKFFSNGLDLNHTRETPNFFRDQLNPVLRKLLTYSMPTVALINGHTFGAGVFLAIAQDYRIQHPSKGFICLPEVDLGILIPSTLAILVKEKMPSLLTYRDAALEGRRIAAKEALTTGLVDGLGGLDEVLKFIEARKLVQKSQAGMIGGLKEDANRTIITAMDQYDEDAKWREDIERRRKKADAEARQQVEKWSRESKL